SMNSQIDAGPWALLSCLNEADERSNEPLMGHHSERALAPVHVQRSGGLMPTEMEKMLAGELYDPLDPELVQARERARDLCQDLNATRERDREARRRILMELFGQGGESVWMQPPFFCDYGSNILLGERVFFNFNCVVLDVCVVRIGDFTLFGPAVQIYTATHPMNAELRRKQEFAKPIEIGSDVWVGGG